MMIIGGTGTISEPVTRLLLERDHDVVVFNRGRRAAAPEGVRTVTGDRADASVFASQMREHGPYDCVIDMICYTADQARQDVEILSPLTKQLIFTSTVDVHRKECLNEYLDLPASEKTEFGPCKGFDYALNKVECEDVFSQASQRGDLAVTTIRPALTYREGSAPLHPLWGGSSQIDRILKKKPIILHGDGTSLWTACHSEDVAVAYANAVGNHRAFGKAYIVAGEQWMTWEYYWRAVAAVVGEDDPRFVHIPTEILVRMAPDLANWLPYHFRFHAVFDSAAARQDLGFRFTIPWEEGARRCVAWFQANGGFEDSDSYPEYDRIVLTWEKAIGDI